MIWQNTTIATEIPVDEEFFGVMRAVNASLPNERKLRVLLGDPPIDWNHVQNRADHFTWLAMRDTYPAALIQLEVMAKQRRALVVYGQLHFQRKNVMANLDMQDWRMQTIVSLLERSTPTKIFTIWNFDDELVALQPDVASWARTESRHRSRNHTWRGRHHGVHTDARPHVIPKRETRSGCARSVAFAASRGSVRCRALPRATLRDDAVAHVTQDLL